MRPNPSPRSLVTRSNSGLSLALVHCLRDRCVRNERGLFLAEGVRFLTRAVETKWPIACVVVCPKLFSSPYGNHLVRQLVGEGIPRLKVSAPEFAALSGALESDEPRQGVLIVARQRWDPLPEIVLPQDLWLGLETIRSAGNHGTLLRTSEAVGVTRQLIFDRSSQGSHVGIDPFDPITVRASMGSIFSQRFTRTTHRDFRAWKNNHPLRAFGATAEGELDYRQGRYLGSSLVMLGDERKGLSPGQLASCDHLIRIPMQGRPDSLNVAMAGAVLLYEAFGQRNPLTQ